jgi:hypothetical protein
MDGGRGTNREVGVAIAAPVLNIPWRRPGAMAAIVLVASVLAAGCSDSGPKRLEVFPTTGQVTFQGRPATGAWVVFYPISGDTALPCPKAQVDGQGNFALTTYDREDGAPAGEYVVTLELRPPVNVGGDIEAGPNVLPPQYSNPETTNIVATIAAGPNTVPIKIVR